MHRKTHNRVTKAVLPKLPTSKIDRINRRIDKPIPTAPAPPKFARVPLLPPKGHRKSGHDILTAPVIGYQEAGLQGVAAAGIHLGLDILSNLIARKCGAGVRDLLEAGGNVAFDAYKRKNKRIKKKVGRRRKSTPRKPAR